MNLYHYQKNYSKVSDKLSTTGGFTLVEMLIVLSIMAVVFVGVFSSSSADREVKLDLAAQELADAIRFCRGETVRTGTSHGINVDLAAQHPHVYRVDTSGPLPVPTYDIYHPVDKKLYGLKFDSDPVFSGIAVSMADFYYQGSALPVDSLEFDAWGTPRYNDSNTIRLLSSGEIRLTYDGFERIITVTPLNGRVTVQ